MQATQGQLQRLAQSEAGHPGRKRLEKSFLFLGNALSNSPSLSPPF